MPVSHRLGGCGLQNHPSLDLNLVIYASTDQSWEGGERVERGQRHTPVTNERTENSSWPMRIEDWYTPFPGLCRPGEGSSALTHSSSRPSRAKTYHILWKFLKSEIRETGLSVEKQYQRSAVIRRGILNLSLFSVTPKREVTHIFSSKSVLFVGKSLEPGGVNCVVCSYKKYKIQNTKYKIKSQIENPKSSSALEKSLKYLLQYS